MQRTYQNKFYEVDGNRVELKLSEVVKQTWKNQGVKGFYGGLGVDMIKALPTNTILMLAFEYFRSMFKSDSHH